MNIIKSNNQENVFEQKVQSFIEQNSVKDETLQLLDSQFNWTQQMEEYNYEIFWEEAINALIAYDKKILNILYFETCNWTNKNNQTSKLVSLPWAWRFSVFNFIKIAQEKWLKEIKFDIMKSELEFYKKINNELKNSTLVESVSIKTINNNYLFIINL